MDCTDISTHPYVSICSTGYSELGDGQVMEALNHHLKVLQTQQCQNNFREMILFRGAIEHATRLCRVMVSSKVDLYYT